MIASLLLGVLGLLLVVTEGSPNKIHAKIEIALGIFIFLTALMSFL